MKFPAAFCFITIAKKNVSTFFNKNKNKTNKKTVPLMLAEFEEEEGAEAETGVRGFGAARGAEENEELWYAGIAI